MNIKVIEVGTMYRLIDALRDYSTVLEAEGHLDLSSRNLTVADRLEGFERVGMGLAKIEQFDLDVAHSAVVQMLSIRAEKAQELREAADECDREAKRWENVLGELTA